MKVKTLIDEIKFINTHNIQLKENEGVFTINVKKLNSILDYIDELEEENKKLKESIVNLIKDDSDLQLRINKALRFIVKNAIASDKWEEIEPLEFKPTGEITYKSLSKNKVQELDKILRGEE